MGSDRPESLLCWVFSSRRKERSIRYLCEQICDYITPEKSSLKEGSFAYESEGKGIWTGPTDQEKRRLSESRRMDLTGPVGSIPDRRSGIGNGQLGPSHPQEGCISY